MRLSLDHKFSNDDGLGCENCEHATPKVARVDSSKKGPLSIAYGVDCAEGVNAETLYAELEAAGKPIVCDSRVYMSDYDRKLRKIDRLLADETISSETRTIIDVLLDVLDEVDPEGESEGEEAADCESCENYDACEVDRWQNNDSEGAGE